MNFLKTLTGADRLAEEKSRLEAFLSAFPGAYCGFSNSSKNKSVIAYSDNFCALLGIQNVSSIHDIQNAISISDGALLEGLFIELVEQSKPFSLNVHQEDKGAILRLTGTKGTANDTNESFFIIWAEDISDVQRDIDQHQKTAEKAEKELLQLQKILDHTPLPLWMRDESAAIIWCNQAYADLSGDPPATVLVNQTELKLSSKVKTVSLKELSLKSLKTGEVQKIKSHIVANGKRYLMCLSERPLAGTHLSIGYARDLTKEEELEAEFDRSLKAHEALLENLRSAIIIYDNDQKLEFYNTAYAQLWGLEEQWLNNKPPMNDLLEKLRETRQLPEQADFKAYKKTWTDMFTQLIDPFEDMMYLPNGKALRFLIIPRPTGGLMIIFEDVTSTLELESSYNTLIAVQKETLDNLSEGVAVFGSDGRLKLSNPSYADLWGLNPEDIENEPHISKIVERMKSLYTYTDWDVQKKSIIAQAVDRSIKEGRIERTDGILLDYTTVPLPDGGVLISYFDVTDTVKVEKALRDRNAALEAAEQIKTDFLANVSYQLRTPLNAIMGFAEILDNEYFGKLNEKQKEYTGDIRGAGDKLVTLIDDILDLSTIEAGYLELNPQEIDVHETLTTILDLTNDWARKEDLHISLDCKKSIGSITADDTRLKQILLNLIRNAISFTPKEGKITIGATKADVDDKAYIKLYVSDTGIGISKEDQKRIFDPFERIHKERIDMSPNALAKGAGLGLSLVKNIAELHGGHVSIDSVEGEGTTFNVFIPVESEFEVML